jgi:hypothetical protein
MDRQEETREGGSAPLNPLGNLRRAQMFSSAERSVLTLPPSDERVRDPALSLSGGIFFFAPRGGGVDLVRQLECGPSRDRFRDSWL